jgi:hypothetical protein
VLDSLRSVDGSLRLDCLRPNQALFGEVSLLDVEPCIDQYATPTLGLNTYSLCGLSVECYLVCEYTPIQRERMAIGGSCLSAVGSL